MDAWWRSIDDEDPITLERISALEHAPFSLGGHYFDGAVLSAYVRSRGALENPLSREPLSRDDCRRLDDHLRSCGAAAAPDDGERRGGSVLEAFELQQRVKVRAGGADAAGGALPPSRRAALLVRVVRRAVLALHGLSLIHI